ncbi:bifunctional lysylphosphatidylglycerol flippase/synthetase MprF [Actinokineospora globicatena]|uniref:bifunctional lysylphosphatidylglycerol flippase/synthetase MprF n=1 Tax=Actinokineospora globicatena TaxID=103729 RepID=UPI0020A5E443|nr:DUF2156 domain-containing protein [Actinokineospora globicatena]MCP2303551.1 Uncharacterized conserved protein (DUF2156) [Actinokineospora globicatena]GLW79312.1 hypothetical protein Aglo01_37940 [Actinokineospora globicatena]GLW86278.1 hypothetical protein Aglo02_39170 [Actinokineospora globicatena]
MTTSTDVPALAAIQTHTQAENPAAFLALNDGTAYFTAPGLDGVIAYRPVGRYHVQFGGPFAADADYLPLLRAFSEYTHAAGAKVVAVQLQRHDAERYAADGYTVNQVGASYSVDLAEFTMAGTRFMRLRNKIARSARAGLTVQEVDFDQWADRVAELDRTWLRGKGEDTRELGFLVGQRGGHLQPHRRLFAGVLDGELAGYISYSPVYGTRSGWLHDLSRRVPGELPGIMESINAAAIDTFRGEGAGWLHFGFTPFTGLADALELPTVHFGFAQIVKVLFEHGEALYPARTQLAYKQKWYPHLVTPEYLAFDGEADLAAFAHVFRAAGAF